MKSVAVIGAGVSGLASIKACLEEGLNVECYEKTNEYGGLWRYREEGVSVAQSTMMNTSKEIGAFSDFPPPKDFPYYMPHQTMIRYLEMYVDRFQLLSRIHLQHEVLNVSKTDDYDETGKWKVELKDNATNGIFAKIFDGVMVCTGHHDFPHIPSFPGLEDYQGRIVHTRNYKSPEGCEGKSVLIIGTGNSGADAAVDVSDKAEKVYLCARSCFWVLPRLTKTKRPSDATYRRRPLFILQYSIPYFFLRFFGNYIVGHNIDEISYNKTPEDLILRYTPLINDLIAKKINTGKVTLKGKIKRFTPNGVIFEGEKDIKPIDFVILATGYDVKLPFISSDIINTDNETLELYKHIFPPHLSHLSLGLIGFIQPFGAVFPLFELQARLFVLMLTRKLKRPSIEEMAQDVMNKVPYYAFGRWKCLKVEWIDYLEDISSSTGVRPNFFKLFFTDPLLFWKCYFGPCLPYQYRLNGPHAWKSARSQILNYDDRATDETNSRKTLNFVNIFAWFVLFSVLTLFIAVIM